MQDIVTKLKTLFALVIGIFGAMHLFGGAAFALDRREQRRMLQALQTNYFGFYAHPDGAWTWTIQQQVVRSDLEQLAGPAPDLCGIIGLPFIRRALAHTLCPSCSCLAAQHHLSRVPGFATPYRRSYGRGTS
jgi:hypothetical protein